MQLYEHRKFRCEDDQVEWSEEHEVQFVDMGAFDGKMIDQWLNEHGFEWREQYRPPKTHGDHNSGDG